jgi:poly-gamma-glutamate capsule biosynthesis protein CapA/YwtB (metallophosphatase superfamily)
MLGTAFPEGYLPPSDGRFLLKPVESILRNADITFGNHEGTLFDGIGTPKKCMDSTRCYAFKSPERYAGYLAEAGFDVMSIANNHSGDFGPEARQRTLEVLNKAGIAAAGTIENPYYIFERNGVKYGLACFAPNVGTPSINNIKEAKRIVAKLDSVCDVVIVSFHGGAEGNTRQHVPRQTEIFLKEDRGNVYKFAHAVIDAGADIVFGHGPHVTRAVDLYKNRFIIYSLGNFATYGRFNLKGASGIAPIMKVYVDKDGKFLKARIYPIRQKGEGGPVLDKSGEVIKRLQKLTKQDFPEVPLSIADNGTIVKKTKRKLKK